MAVRNVPAMPRALVIGGGPAGATAAMTLARGGWGVILCEASRFPRDKVCGECLSALGLDTLRRVGLGDALDRLRPVRLTHAALVDRGGRTATIGLPRDVAGVTRAALDAALLDALPAAVERRQPCRVLRLETTRYGVVAETTLGTVEADRAFLADGKGTLPGTFEHHPPPTGDLGLKAHFDGVDLPRETIHLFALRGHYVGLAAASDGGGGHVWNLAFNLPASRMRPGESHDDLLARLIDENPALRDALAGGTRVGDWKASPLPRFAPRPAATWPAGVIPVGNAAAALEPVGGEGMGLAVASAYAAAEAVLDGRPLVSLDPIYRDLWKTRRAACRLAAVALSHEPSATLTVALARALPWAGRLGMRLTGKATASQTAPTPA